MRHTYLQYTHYFTQHQFVFYMDLIPISDVIIDKITVWGLYDAVTKLNCVCSFHNMEQLDNKGNRLVRLLW